LWTAKLVVKPASAKLTIEKNFAERGYFFTRNLDRASHARWGL